MGRLYYFYNSVHFLQLFQIGQIIKKSCPKAAFVKIGKTELFSRGSRNGKYSLSHFAVQHEETGLIICYHPQFIKNLGDI